MITFTKYTEYWSIDSYRLYRLLFYQIEWNRLIFYTIKIDGFQVYATNVAIIHSTIIDNSVCKICRWCPLCGTRYIGRRFTFRKLYTDRYIKVVQNVKALYNSFYRCFFLWRRSLVKSGTYESWWGSDITGNAEEATACTKWGKFIFPSVLGLVVPG